jgi:1,4-alpha-glucan branching enzyme
VSAPSVRAGMGAIPFPGGATFRVWAEHARTVVVAGSFNGWSRTAHPLARDGDGYWSADIDGAAPGDRYKYVLTSPTGEELWRVDPYGQKMCSSSGDSIVHDPAFDWGTAIFSAPGWDELVVYELHVGSFHDSPGGPPGALPSAAAKLPYLADLGVTAVLLLPPAEFPGGFSWGYNSSSIFTVETDYGGPDALKAFIRAAHEHGIAVLCDVVYNHFGTADSAVWLFDGWQDADHPGGIYVYDQPRRHTGFGDRPDYGRPQVRQFLRDNARMWLRDYRFDGLRWDATALISSVDGHGREPLEDGTGLMRRINGEIDAEQPWKISMAEDMQRDPSVTRPVGEGGAGFDTQWDADFVHPVRRALTAVDDADRSMAEVRRAVANRYNGDWLGRVVYVESHDEVARDNGKTRLPAAIDRGSPHSWYARKRATLGAALVLTAPGIPMIFQGQELLETRSWHDDVPLDWADASRWAGIVSLYRDLVALRRNAGCTTRGLRGPNLNVHHVNEADKVIAYHRWADGGPGDDDVVLANFGHRSYPSYRVGLPRAGTWRVRLNTDWSGYDPGFGGVPVFDTATDERAQDGMRCSAEIGLPAYTAVVLSQPR